MRWLLVALLLWVFLMVLCACGPSCKLRQQRCAQGVAQLCGTDGHWRDVLDCFKLKRMTACGCSGDPSRCGCRRVQ